MCFVDITFLGARVHSIRKYEVALRCLVCTSIHLLGNFLSKLLGAIEGEQLGGLGGVSKVKGSMPLKNSLTYSSGLSVVVIVVVIIVVDMVVLSIKK